MMKEWKPQREFKKADFPANPGERKQEKRLSAEKKAPLEPVITTDVKPGRVVKAWMPPSVAEPSQTSAQLPRTTPELFAPESGEQAVRRAAGEADTKRAAADMSKEMLDELVIARPIEATDLLRRWYWQKPEGGTTPQTKIYIILHSMKKETLVELYRCFTAMERRQMHEIFSKKRTVVKSEILSVRGEFMQRLSHTFT